MRATHYVSLAVSLETKKKKEKVKKRVDKNPPAIKDFSLMGLNQYE
jgi:flagellar basal body-associated protein FliL